MENEKLLNGKYRKIAKIGLGSFGSVLKMLDTVTDQTVAVKKIHFDIVKREKECIDKEIAFLTTLSHPNILSLIEYFSTETNIYLVTPLCEIDLLKLYKSKVPLSCLKNILFQVLEGIAYLHTQNVVHRDIKPENVLISSQGTVKICDFSIATELKPIMTKYQVTLWYRAHEIFFGSNCYDQTVDIWAFGCMLYEVITGEVLFNGTGELNMLIKIFEVTGSPTVII